MLENHAIENLTDIIEKKLDDPERLQKVKEISLAVLQGTPQSDACLISRVKPETFEKWIEEVPEIKEHLNIKRLMYKQKLQKTLYEQATVNGDFKVALQLLIAGFPDEFNPAIQKEKQKLRGDTTNDRDVLAEVFELIQEDPNQTVNKETAVQEPNVKEEGIKQTIEKILA